MTRPDPAQGDQSKAEGTRGAVSTGFLPSVHGFRFRNSFTGIPLPHPLRKILLGLSRTGPGYGLCGGMCAGTLDFFLQDRRRIPPDAEVPASGSPLHDYLVRRQVATLTSRNVLQFLAGMALPLNGRDGLRRRSADHLIGRGGIVKDLEQGRPVILGLVHASIRGDGRVGSMKESQLTKIWDNHQVLAHGVTRGPNGSLTLHAYDPNRPGCDDVVVACERVEVGTRTVRKGVGREKRAIHGFACELRQGSRPLSAVRGCFRVTCSPVAPPPDL